MHRTTPLRRARALAAAAAFTASLAACAADPPAPQAFSDLARGQYGPCAEARREVVQDAARWAQVWAELQPTRAAAPPLDFATEVALVVCLGQQSSGGHAIAIVAVELEADALRVTVRERAPVPGAITTQALTQPYHAVRVARAGLPVRWIETR